MPDNSAAIPGYQPDDETLSARIELATDLILTSGTITAEDVAKGWFDNPSPDDKLQHTVILLGLTVILGGLNGAPADAVVDAWHTPRLLHGAIRAMLDAVDILRMEVV